nr:MAG TPA: hypothetical protein [Caudoviricetes sp.]DAQ14710.1 MAG TPA: hypothetical protein [Caudoviricetes sp.]
MPCGVEYHSLVRAGFAVCRSRSLFVIKAKKPLGKAEGPVYKGAASISPFVCELGSSQRGSVYFQLFAVIL